jgi:Zn-dependent M28 family amino/carboxypeptidase
MGYFYRSDHLEFIREGVPTLSSCTPARGTSTGRRSELYHKPGDAIEDDWDLAGMVEDVRMLTRIGRDVADATERPTWSPESEFAPRA